MSADAQINAVFDMNPPDVLICLSCSNRDLYPYRNGFVLESMKHDRLTQRLHTDDRKFPGNKPRYSVHAIVLVEKLIIFNIVIN